jgi:hypothetical protein
MFPWDKRSLRMNTWLLTMNMSSDTSPQVSASKVAPRPGCRSLPNSQQFLRKHQFPSSRLSRPIIYATYTSKFRADTNAQLVLSGQTSSSLRRSSRSCHTCILGSWTCTLHLLLSHVTIAVSIRHPSIAIQLSPSAGSVAPRAYNLTRCKSHSDSSSLPLRFWFDLCQLFLRSCSPILSRCIVAAMRSVDIAE